METIYERVGALDVHRAQVTACVRVPDDGGRREPLRADQMGGIPCIRGLRIPVATVVDMVADGVPASEILEAYPDLEPDDVTEALRYAAEAVRERELPLTAAG